MNFDYIKNAEPETETLRMLYADLYKELEQAEAVYWSEPQKCGRILRRATENICHIYNHYYGIGFGDDTSLEEYLCYTDKDEHNVMVSRFLSVVRSEQRDRLEWLRVWGDECSYMEEHPEEIEKSPDKLYLDIKKMMVQMLAATRDMCEKINHMKELGDRTFEENILPGYLTEEEALWREKEIEKESRRSIFRFFKKR